MSIPNSRRNLDITIGRLAKDSDEAVRIRRTMANAIVGQLLPDRAVKGGSSLKLRFGDGPHASQGTWIQRVRPISMTMSNGLKMHSHLAGTASPESSYPVSQLSPRAFLRNMSCNLSR